MQGAGGVGGLLLIQEAGNSYLPAYDGNGNVHAMIKASDGSVAAAYEYDAFGNTLRESGTYAASNPIRFSTKYTDTETGLALYGLRFYGPTLGRFINRDPISEEGGLNLYGFCGNNGVNRYDYLGMEEVGEMPEWAKQLVDYMTRTFGQWSYPGMSANPIDLDLYGGLNGRSLDGPATTSLVDRLAYDRTHEGAFTGQNGLLGSTATGDSRGPAFTGTNGTGNPNALKLDKFVIRGSDTTYPGDSVVSPYAPNSSDGGYAPGDGFPNSTITAQANGVIVGRFGQVVLTSNNEQYVQAGVGFLRAISRSSNKEVAGQFAALNSVAELTGNRIVLQLGTGGNVKVGAFSASFIDMGDIMKFPVSLHPGGFGGTQLSTFGHELFEQMHKQAWGGSDYQRSHTFAISMENLLAGATRGNSAQQGNSLAVTWYSGVQARTQYIENFFPSGNITGVH